MKMLQVLVCYLAITAQPFHPFVFAASSLASINHDGYTNKTHIDSVLIEVLDSIVEACQTVTTQKHGDGALMKHASGDTIEARQEGGPPPLPGTLAVGLMITAVAIGVAWILEDNPVRGKDVKCLVEHLTRVFY